MSSLVLLVERTFFSHQQLKQIMVIHKTIKRPTLVLFFLNMDMDVFCMDSRDRTEVFGKRGYVKRNQFPGTKTTTDIQGNSKCHV